MGRYGPYLQRGEDRAAVPDDLAPDELTLERAAELLEHPSSDRALGEDPRHRQDGAAARGALRALRPARRGRRGGRQAADGLVAQDDGPGRRSASSEALRLLQLPRTVGADPATGEEIIAANGRFGPFLKRGNETRSLESEEQLFTVTIEEALGAVLGAQAAPLRRPAPLRCASSAATRSRAPRSCCARAASGPMSPTGRRTPRCGAATMPTS